VYLHKPYVRWSNYIITRLQITYSVHVPKIMKIGCH